MNATVSNVTNFYQPVCEWLMLDREVPLLRISTVHVIQCAHQTGPDSGCGPKRSAGGLIHTRRKRIAERIGWCASAIYARHHACRTAEAKGRTGITVLRRRDEA